MLSLTPCGCVPHLCAHLALVRGCWRCHAFSYRSPWTVIGYGRGQINHKTCSHQSRRVLYLNPSHPAGQKQHQQHSAEHWQQQERQQQQQHQQAPTAGELPPAAVVAAAAAVSSSGRALARQLSKLLLQMYSRPCSCHTSLQVRVLHYAFVSPNCKGLKVCRAQLIRNAADFPCCRPAAWCQGAAHFF